jgi:hypothetical protein
VLWACDCFFWTISVDVTNLRRLLKGEKELKVNAATKSPLLTETSSKDVCGQ